MQGTSIIIALLQINVIVVVAVVVGVAAWACRKVCLIPTMGHVFCIRDSVPPMPFGKTFVIRTSTTNLTCNSSSRGSAAVELKAAGVAMVAAAARAAKVAAAEAPGARASPVSAAVALSAVVPPSEASGPTVAPWNHSHKGSKN